MPKSVTFYLDGRITVAVGLGGLTLAADGSLTAQGPSIELTADAMVIRYGAKDPRP